MLKISSGLMGIWKTSMSPAFLFLWLQVICLANCNGAKVPFFKLAMNSTIAEFRQHILETCSKSNDFLVVAYSRKGTSYSDILLWQGTLLRYIAMKRYVLLRYIAMKRYALLRYIMTKRYVLLRHIIMKRWPLLWYVSRIRHFFCRNVM